MTVIEILPVAHSTVFLTMDMHYKAPARGEGTDELTASGRAVGCSFAGTFANRDDRRAEFRDWTDRGADHTSKACVSNLLTYCD